MKSLSTVIAIGLFVSCIMVAQANAQPDPNLAPPKAKVPPAPPPAALRANIVPTGPDTVAGDLNSFDTIFFNHFGKLGYLNREALRISEFGADFHARVVKQWRDEETWTQYKEFTKLSSEKKVGLIDFPQLLGFNNAVVHGNTMYTASITELKLMHPNSGYALGFQATKDNAVLWTWVMIIKKPPENGTYVPFDVSEQGDIVAALPGASSTIAIINTTEGSVDLITFADPEAPKAQGASVPEGLRIKSQINVPMEIGGFHSLYCFSNGRIVIIESNQSRALIIDRQGHVIKSFEEAPEKLRGTHLNADRKYLGVGKEYLVAFEEGAVGGAFIGFDGKVLGRFSLPLFRGETSDGSRYDRAFILNDKEFAILRGADIWFFEISPNFTPR